MDSIIGFFWTFFYVGFAFASQPPQNPLPEAQADPLTYLLILIKDAVDTQNWILVCLLMGILCLLLGFTKNARKRTKEVFSVLARMIVQAAKRSEKKCPEGDEK